MPLFRFMNARREFFRIVLTDTLAARIKVLFGIDVNSPILSSQKLSKLLADVPKVAMLLWTCCAVDDSDAEAAAKFAQGLDAGSIERGTRAFLLALRDRATTSADKKFVTECLFAADKYLNY